MSNSSTISHDPLGGAAEELLALGAGGQQRAVGGQGHAQGLAQAVHAVGREHAASTSRRWGSRPAPAPAVRRPLSLPSCLAAAATNTSIRSTVLPSGVLPASIGPPLTKIVGMLQRTAPINMPGTILSQLGMQIMPSKQWALEHRLDRVGDQLAAGQRVLHARVAHGDAVVDADGVEDERHAARLADALLDELADLVQVDVAGDDVDVAVADGDERLVEIVVAHAGGAQQAAMGGPGVAQLDDVGSHRNGALSWWGYDELIYCRLSMSRCCESASTVGRAQRSPTTSCGT